MYDTKMDGSLEFLSWRRAEGTVDWPYPLTVEKEKAAKGWTELGEGSLLGEREVYFFCWYLRRRSLKDIVWTSEVYGLGNRYIMKEFDGSFRINCAENIVLEINGNTIAEPRLEVVFHVSETWGGGDYILGRIARLSGSVEKLGT